MRSLLALLAAAAMVVGALVIRRTLIDDDAPGANDARVRLACVDDLADVCDGLPRDRFDVIDVDVTTAQPGDLDAWLTFAPLAERENERRTFAGAEPLFDGGAGAAVASSPLTLVARTDRLEALRAACRTVDWRCLARHAGTPWASLGGDPTWGNVRIGHANPATSATGLLVIGSAATGLLEGSVPVDQLSRTDFDDPAFRAGFARLERDGVPKSFLDRLTDETPMEQFVGTRFAAADAVAVSRAQAGAVPDGAEAIALDPAATAVVTLAQTRGDAAAISDDDVEALRRALQDGGYNTDDPPGTGPEGTGLPRGGVLDAVLDVWEETVR